MGWTTRESWYPDCPHGPQRCNARGMRLIMRTAVTTNFTLASSGFKQNYKGKIFNGENYTLTSDH